MTAMLVPAVPAVAVGSNCVGIIRSGFPTADPVTHSDRAVGSTARLSLGIPQRHPVPVGALMPPYRSGLPLLLVGYPRRFQPVSDHLPGDLPGCELDPRQPGGLDHLLRWGALALLRFPSIRTLSNMPLTCGFTLNAHSEFLRIV